MQAVSWLESAPGSPASSPLGGQQQPRGGVGSPLPWVSPLQGATWGAASALPQPHAQAARVGSPHHRGGVPGRAPGTGQQYDVPRFGGGGYVSSPQREPGFEGVAARQGGVPPPASARHRSAASPPSMHGCASAAHQGAEHEVQVGEVRCRQLEASVQVATQHQEMDGFLEDLDRLEGWVQKWAHQEERQEYLAGNHEVREDSYVRAGALKVISSQLKHARSDAVPGEAAGTGSTPMTGEQGGLAPPKWNNPKAAVPSNFTFDSELQRLQMEVEAIRGKTQKDLGLSPGSGGKVFFV